MSKNTSFWHVPILFFRIQCLESGECPLGLAIIEGLKYYLWLVATILYSTGLKHLTVTLCHRDTLAML